MGAIQVDGLILMAIESRECVVIKSLFLYHHMRQEGEVVEVIYLHTYDVVEHPVA